MPNRAPSPEIEEALRREVARLRAELDAANETASVATAARDAFFDAAAHSLRTPLHVLMLQLSSLTSGPAAFDVPAELRPKVASMDRQVQHLARLTDRLVDVTTLENGHIPLRRSRLDLVRLATASVSRLQEELRWAGCAVQVRAPSTIFVEADPVRLDEVVGNLLANAATYAAGAPVTVAIERGQELARVVVMDKGPGIASHLRSRIFDKFDRGNGPTGTSGLGLGLWMARKIVEAHGGTIEVEDAPQGGAAFVVAIPCLAANAG
jgi:signal transduction histidine kinase